MNQDEAKKKEKDNMKLKLRSKGLTLSDMAGVGMALAMVGMILGFGTMINSEIKDATFSGVLTNETLTLTNFTYSALAYESAGTVTLANITDTFPAANVTQTESGKVTIVRVVVSDMYLAGDYNATYMALSETGAGVLDDSTESIGTLTSWLPIIAVVLAAAVVLGTLVNSLGGGGEF